MELEDVEEFKMARRKNRQNNKNKNKGFYLNRELFFLGVQILENSL